MVHLDRLVPNLTPRVRAASRLETNECFQAGQGWEQPLGLCTCYTILTCPDCDYNNAHVCGPLNLRVLGSQKCQANLPAMLIVDPNR